MHGRAALVFTRRAAVPARAGRPAGALALEAGAGGQQAEQALLLSSLGAAIGQWLGLPPLALASHRTFVTLRLAIAPRG